MSVDLYDRDFLLWTEEQAAALRRAGETRVNAPVDWQAVAEEIEDLGRRQKFAAESLLRQIILHLLKLQLTRAAEPRAHWRKEVGNFRDDLHKELEDSPSLEGKLDLARVYRYARRRAVRDLPDWGIDPQHIPHECPFSLDQLLDEDWWPENRHGLT
ncbi:MAG: DUF29 family protein [Alphaproteobacteria bacterium]|jgi:hypothetical protein|nr:DUF29 family protein [Alphaproteobacteria bacterium]